LDIALDDGCGDKHYLSKLQNILPKLLDIVTPDIVLFLAGVDVLQADRLGRLKLSRAGCKKRDEIVFRYCKLNAIPVAVSMGGGYSEKLSDIVEAHANTFRLAQEIFF